MQTLSWSRIFPYPMDRAEALHAASYDIKLSWKNTPGENELVLSCEISTFPSKKYTYVKPDLPRNMPAVTKNITLQEAKPSLRVTSEFLWGRFASAKPICDFEHHFEPGAASFQQIS